MIALVILSGSTDFCSAMLRRRLGAPSRLDLNVLNLSQRGKESRGSTLSRGRKADRKSQVALRLRVLPTWVRAGLSDILVSKQITLLNPPLLLPLFITFVLIIFSFWYVKADFSKLWSQRTAQLLIGVIQDAFPPDISQLSQLFTLSTQTVAMSILAIAIAGFGGILLSFPAANNFLLPGGILDSGGNQNHILGTTILVFTRLLLLFTRAIPEPIWALIFLFMLFPGILPGSFALGIHNLGILGRLMAEVTENMDPRPVFYRVLYLAFWLTSSTAGKSAFVPQ